MIPIARWAPSDGLVLEPNALDAAKETARNLALTAGPGAGKTEMLAQRADLNGRVGTVVEVDFLASSGRCTVDLGGGLKPVRVKPANLDVVAVDPVAEAAKAAADERVVDLEAHVAELAASIATMSQNSELALARSRTSELEAAVEGGCAGSQLVATLFQYSLTTASSASMLSPWRQGGGASGSGLDSLGQRAWAACPISVVLQDHASSSWITVGSWLTAGSGAGAV